MRNARTRGDRGASLTLVAISLSALIGIGAIAIDLGMLLKARADAQRAAEAGALAGASVYMEVGVSPTTQQTTAEALARQFTEANAILNLPVADGEVEVTFPAPQTVRVVVARSGIGTWFAKIFGEDSIPVSSRAAASVVESGGTDCVRPLMIPDLWTDPSQDANSTGVEDNGEDWTYDPGQDQYAGFDQHSSAPQTGYGSAARNGLPDMTGSTYLGDYGRELSLVPAAATGGPLGPNDFQLWDYRDPGSNPPTLEERVNQCDPRVAQVGRNDYERMGTDPAEVMDELQNLLNQNDPTGARWDPNTGTMQAGSGDWRNSPKVIKVALFDPQQLASLAGAGDPVTFNNFGLFLLESVTGTGITGRFLYYVSGNNDEAVGGGSLVRHVRLVE